MAKLEMTLDEYGKSPAGKGNVTGSQYLAEAYKTKFEKVMLRYNGRIDHNFYTDGKSYFILLRVPSEVVSKFTYEVVFKFSPTKMTDSHSSTLKNYKVQFFSNDPAFTFTYAYVYNAHGILVDELLDKVPDEVLKTKPKERNPYGVINFAKILYFGFLYIRQHGFLEKHYYSESNLAIRNSNDFFKLILDCSTKAQLRQEGEKQAQAIDPLFKHRLLKRGVKSGGNANKVVKHIGKIKTVNTTAASMQSKELAKKLKSNIRKTKTTKRI